MDIIKEEGTCTQTVTFDEKKAREVLETGYSLAEKTLKDEDSVERLLQRIEKKLRGIRLVGKKLATIPVLVSLVRSYTKKEYTDIPVGSIIAIVSALIYFVSPIDIVPDSIPFLGYFDDAMVVSVCWQLVESDVAEYQNWREENHRLLNV